MLSQFVNIVEALAFAGVLYGSIKAYILVFALLCDWELPESKRSFVVSFVVLATSAILMLVIHGGFY